MMKIIHMFVLSLLISCVKTSFAEINSHWWKGNTHTHSWWSDGDAPPEAIAAWYKNHGYQFLVFSDHNIMQVGEKWYSIDKPPRRPEQIRQAYKDYVKQFGDDWVEEREINGEKQVKLKTLDEFRALFEETGKFIFIKGEEITDRFEYHPVHINGINLVEKIAPQGGNSVSDVMQNTFDAVKSQSEQYAQPMIAHLNHPNFHFAQTAEDFFFLDVEAGDGYFEIYNGHPHVFNQGDDLHESAERMWDIVLAKRLGELNKSMIYGVAVDDAHEYVRWGATHTNPGRGWIMVKAPLLTPNEITNAIKRGDFYNSTGVTLKAIKLDKKGIHIEIAAEDGVQYTTEFIGTQKNADLNAREETITHKHVSHQDHRHKPIRRYSDDIGKVLQSSGGATATYRFTGDEIYVRARIKSNKARQNSELENDTEMAWTQAAVPE